ncbi:MAG: hypothetical protein ACU84J_04520 [Gammaproteobacteria bacterium]
MINSALVRKSPASAGLFLCLLLTACMTAQAPEEVTLAFWNALSEDDLEKAKSFVTEDSRGLLTSASRPRLQNTTFKTGKIVIDGDNATVETLINSKVGSDSDTFLTVLVKKDGQWRIDYRETVDNLSGNLLGGFINSLQKLGDKINKQLEQHLPKLEQQLESLGNEFERQIDEFGDKLDEDIPPRPARKQPDII